VGMNPAGLETQRDADARFDAWLGAAIPLTAARVPSRGRWCLPPRGGMAQRRGSAPQRTFLA
jgi:hypothetical protein